MSRGSSTVTNITPLLPSAFAFGGYTHSNDTTTATVVPLSDFSGVPSAGGAGVPSGDPPPHFSFTPALSVIYGTCLAATLSTAGRHGRDNLFAASGVIASGVSTVTVGHIPGKVHAHSIREHVTSKSFPETS